MSEAGLAGTRQTVDAALLDADRELQRLIASTGLDEAALASALARARERARSTAPLDHPLPELGLTTELEGEPSVGVALREALRQQRLALLKRHAVRHAPAPPPPPPLGATSTDPVVAALAQAAQKVTRVHSGEAVASGFDLSDASAAAGVANPTIEGIPEEVFADTGEFRDVASATAAPAPAPNSAEPPPPTLVDALSEDTDLNGFELDETIEPDGFDDPPHAAEGTPIMTSATPTASARDARSLDEVLGGGSVAAAPQPPPAPAQGSTPPPTRVKSGLFRRIFGKDPKDGS
ncbi:MAG: hypothetical protein IPL40_12605 [Proteobacteria bacterium]|nr:hypothetical protein [Pseudomonadota bacterium]